VPLQNFARKVAAIPKKEPDEKVAHCPSRILNVLSAQTESISVTGFPGENFLSDRSAKHLGLCL
jgi:hypothetical protein